MKLRSGSNCWTSCADYYNWNSDDKIEICVKVLYFLAVVLVRRNNLSILVHYIWCLTRISLEPAGVLRTKFSVQGITLSRRRRGARQGRRPGLHSTGGIFLCRSPGLNKSEILWRRYSFPSIACGAVYVHKITRKAVSVGCFSEKPREEEVDFNSADAASSLLYV